MDGSAATPRAAAIVEAAASVFRRYGFKKTSMDDLARAAGLSRQGLYLHFPTKESLFKAALQKVLAEAKADGRAALEREGVDLEARLLEAFVAMHGRVIGTDGAENFAELLETAAALMGSFVADAELGFVADVARALRAAGVSARWRAVGLTGRDLAQHLLVASMGAKAHAESVADYREMMRTAIRVVCRGAHV